MTTIIYIHGFNSSPLSQKATLMRSELNKLEKPVHFLCPGLPELPALAIAELSKLVEEALAGDVTLIGSSLGGFYATWLVEEYGCKAILINPAISPHLDLKNYIGTQINHHTKQTYKLTNRHLDQLEKLNVKKITVPRLFFLLQNTGDELLDWRVAKDRYSEAKQLIIEGGDHGFTNFKTYLPAILDFCGLV